MKCIEALVRSPADWNDRCAPGPGPV